ncbi:MAG TPA: hypothetical protein ENI94_06610 [Gammaproteobacteria bacterium]|nr:hypothetical protein [Gammaproteobacteria bacterium]
METEPNKTHLHKAGKWAGYIANAAFIVAVILAYLSPDDLSKSELVYGMVLFGLLAITVIGIDLWIFKQIKQDA